jgi:hypothetical protein
MFGNFFQSTSQIWTYLIDVRHISDAKGYRVRRVDAVVERQLLGVRTYPINGCVLGAGDGAQSAVTDK